MKPHIQTTYPQTISTSNLLSKISEYEIEEYNIFIPLAPIPICEFWFFLPFDYKYGVLNVYQFNLSFFGFIVAVNILVASDYRKPS